MSHLEIYQQERIRALESEIERLNQEIQKVKEMAFKVKVSDPIFLKPLTQVETNFKII
jgi:hypothetical protein